MVFLASIATVIGILVPLFSPFAAAAIRNPKEAPPPQPAPRTTQMNKGDYSVDDHMLLFGDYPISLSNYPILERDF